MDVAILNGKPNLRYIFFCVKRNLLASHAWRFPHGTNETASLIIHDNEIFLANCPTVHNAA